MSSIYKYSLWLGFVNPNIRTDAKQMIKMMKIKLIKTALIAPH